MCALTAHASPLESVLLSNYLDYTSDGRAFRSEFTLLAVMHKAYLIVMLCYAFPGADCIHTSMYMLRLAKLGGQFLAIVVVYLKFSILVIDFCRTSIV